MAALGFLLLLSLSPEQQLSFQLGSVHDLTVTFGTSLDGTGGETVVLHEPRKVLRCLTVTWLANGVTEDASHCRIRFGTLCEAFVVPGGQSTLASGRNGILFGVEAPFWRKLSAAVSEKTGRQVNVLTEGKVSP